MAYFKTTYNILKVVDENELDNFYQTDSNTPWMPPTTDWDYSREMQIEDVDVWEVLFEASGGIGVYVSWAPYAEFYLISTGWKPKTSSTQLYNDKILETYYGPGAQQQVFARAKQLNIPLSVENVWVDNQDMWLYNKP